MLHSSAQRQAVLFVLLLDSVIFAYLYYQGEAFGESE